MHYLEYKVFTNSGERGSAGARPKASLFVAFYNSRAHFDRLMASLERQSCSDFEVVLCDDGSGDGLVDHVHEYMRGSSLLVRHIWQEDDGWRKAELLNKALLNCASDYIIAVDQDCLLHSRFVEDHLRHRAKSVALAGRRVELPAYLSKRVTPKWARTRFIERNYWWLIAVLALSGKTWPMRGVRVSNERIRSLMDRPTRALLGSNMSFYKEDVMALNGFDMSGNGQPCGAEDSDLYVRFLNGGVRMKSVCFNAIQYHLHHSKTEAVADWDVFAKHKRDRIVRTACGVDQLTPVAAIQI